MPIYGWFIWNTRGKRYVTISGLSSEKICVSLPVSYSLSVNTQSRELRPK